MAKITDPDDLTYELNTVAAGSANIVIDTAASLIEINTGGLLSDDGATLQAIYSKIKEIWKNEPLAIPFLFPMEPITPEQFEFINGWKLEGTTVDETLSTSEQLVRDAGFLYRQINGTVDAEFIGFDSVFALNNNNQAGGDQVYVEFDEPNGITQDMYITGQANQPLKVFLNGTHDFRNNDLRFFCREQGKDFAFSSVSSLNVPLPLTYKKYSFPLSNSLDTKINGVSGLQDIDIFNVSFQPPFNGMSITSYAVPQSRTIGGVSYDFDIILDANNATAEQLYAFVQYQLRQTTDIDADGVATLDGNTADELLTFVGDTLITIRDRNGRGVYIDNFDTNDTNRLTFNSNASNDIQFPFVAAGNLQFNANLVSDTSARFWMYFENDDAGANAGNDFLTNGAILVNGNTKVESTGAADVSFTSPNTIGSTPLDLSVFAVGDVIQVVGSTSNDGYYEVATTSANTLTVNAFGGGAASLTTEAGLITTDIIDTIAGAVGGNAAIGWDFDYDNNVQRGSGSDGVDAPIVVVAIGLNTGQYVRTPLISEGGSQTITRNVGQNIGLVAALERNYSNP